MARQPAWSGVAVGEMVGRRAREARRAWQTLTRPPVVHLSQSDVTLSESATVNAQIWWSQFPLRPTAGWAVLAALLAAGALGPTVDWRAVVLLWLLADPLWGSVWRLAAGRLELLPLREQDVAHTVWLPYLQPGSPAARLLGRDDHGVLHLLMRVALPSALLALLIAATLGSVAVGLTLTLLALGMAGWLIRHTIGHVPALLHSLATVALPWGLALGQMGVSPADELWTAQLALAGLWTLHNWGEGRVLRHPADPLGIGLLAVGDLGVAVLLVAVRAPLWLAVMSVLWLPTWLLVARRRPLRRAQVWWLAGMWVSGLALGQALLAL